MAVLSTVASTLMLQEYPVCVSGSLMRNRQLLGKSVQKLYRCMIRQCLSHPAVKRYDVKSMQLTQSIPITVTGCITSCALRCPRRPSLMLQVSVHFRM